MPAINLTDPLNDTLADANLIAANNALLENLLNGGLDSSNVADGTLTASDLNLFSGIALPSGKAHASITYSASDALYRLISAPKTVDWQHSATFFPGATIEPTFPVDGYYLVHWALTGFSAAGNATLQPGLGSDTAAYASPSGQPVGPDVGGTGPRGLRHTIIDHFTAAQSLTFGGSQTGGGTATASILVIRLPI